MKKCLWMAAAWMVASVGLAAQEAQPPQETDASSAIARPASPEASAEPGQPARPVIRRDGLIAGQTPAPSQHKLVTLKAGAKVAIALKVAIDTHTAKPGDPIYAEVNFPVVVDGRVVIPAGTFVQGEVVAAKRAGHIKGRAELLAHFSMLIFANGYAVTLPAATDNVPGNETASMKNKEGAIQGGSGAGAKAAKVANAAADCLVWA